VHRPLWRCCIAASGEVAVAVVVALGPTGAFGEGAIARPLALSRAAGTQNVSAVPGSSDERSVAHGSGPATLRSAAAEAPSAIAFWNKAEAPTPRQSDGCFSNAMQGPPQEGCSPCWVYEDMLQRAGSSNVAKRQCSCSRQLAWQHAALAQCAGNVAR